MALSTKLLNSPPSSPRSGSMMGSMDELERLRLRVAELEQKEEARRNVEPPTLESLSASIETLAEGQQRLEALVLAGLGKDVEGNRGPPAGCAELAASIVHMEKHGMSPEQVENAKQIFDLYDKDSSGTMDADELMDVLRFLGQNPTRERVEQQIEEVDRWLANEISLNEFLNIYASIILADEERIAEVSPIFTDEDQKSPTHFVDRTVQREEVNIATISEYGVFALMRWVHHDDDEVGGDVTGPLVPFLRRAGRIIVLRRDSEYMFYFSIFLSAVSSGLNTYEDLVDLPIVQALGVFTMVVFVTEVMLKFIAEAQSWASIRGYFGHFWNSFDFSVLVSIGVLTPFLESQKGIAALRGLRILRLARALRILRAAKVLPKLMLVLETLIASVSSVAYIGLFMLLVSYIFAIVAVTMFGKNDPFHFGDLGSAMLTLFRIATQEDWTDIMYFNMFGCDKWGDYISDVAESTAGCIPEAFGTMSPAFFVLYITVTTFLLLNLFIGVIVNSMMETRAEAEKKKEEAKSWAVATRLKTRSGGKLSQIGKGVAGGVSGMAGAAGSAARKATKGISGAVSKAGIDKGSINDME